MSVWQNVVPSSVPHCLHSPEGELVSVHIRVEPRLLEDLLEALAEVPFPINPQLHHNAAMRRGGGERRAVAVEFPAYAPRVEEVRSALRRHGLDADVEVVNMLEEIQGDHPVY